MVESSPCSLNVGSTSVDHPPALQAGFLLREYVSARRIASLVECPHIVLACWPPFREDAARNVTNPGIALLAAARGFACHLQLGLAELKLFGSRNHLLQLAVDI